jgi:hypothetical protein
LVIIFTVFFWLHLGPEQPENNTAINMSMLAPRLGALVLFGILLSLALFCLSSAASRGQKIKFPRVGRH